MDEHRIEKLKKLLEELVPDDINYQGYVDELESQWATDTFFRGNNKRGQTPYVIERIFP
jgi:hypothetical protein